MAERTCPHCRKRPVSFEHVNGGAHCKRCAKKETQCTTCWTVTALPDILECGCGCDQKTCYHCYVRCYSCDDVFHPSCCPLLAKCNTCNNDIDHEELPYLGREACVSYVAADFDKRHICSKCMDDPVDPDWVLCADCVTYAHIWWTRAQDHPVIGNVELHQLHAHIQKRACFRTLALHATAHKYRPENAGYLNAYEEFTETLDLTRS